jgi:hypothetical protein
MTRKSQPVQTGSRSSLLDAHHASADRAPELDLELDGARTAETPDDDAAEGAQAEQGPAEQAHADQAQAGQAQADQAHAHQSPTEALAETGARGGDAARLPPGPATNDRTDAGPPGRAPSAPGAAPGAEHLPRESTPDESGPAATLVDAPARPPPVATEKAPAARASELITSSTVAFTATEAPREAVVSPTTSAPTQDGATRCGILCRVAGPGSVAGSGFLPDGRPGHFWVAGERGYFSQASIDKLPHLLIPVRT